MTIDLGRIVRQISGNAAMNDGIKAARERKSEFADNLEMMLTGIAMNPMARDKFDALLTTQFDRSQDRDYKTGRFGPIDRAQEVIIGAGLHAAVYCAVRVRKGFPKPLVLESSGRPGGTFGMSSRPAFYLNSRNTPGRFGQPGDRNAQLNYLPAAPVQPVSLSGSEYQSNTDIGWIVRVMLAMFADVRTRFTVSYVGGAPEYPGYGSGDYPYYLESAEGTRDIMAGRVIDARGIGQPDVPDANGKSVMTFPQLVKMADQRYSWRGMRRAAVVGAGDSARCAVESLLGIGPSAAGNVARLDYVGSVDWYGRTIPTTTFDWRRTERGRYLRIASALPERKDGSIRGDSRLKVYQQRGTITPAYDGVFVNDRVYDTVIACTGATLPEIAGMGVVRDYQDVGNGSASRFSSQKLTIGRKYDGDREFYAMGPAARIPLSDREEGTAVSEFPENVNSIFRLANRTAALAVRLPRIV